MLSRALPLSESRQEVTVEQEMECHALSLLSKYNTETIQPRVLQSFQRAFAISSIVMTARVPNGRPGFLISYSTTENVKKVTVAIESSESVSQYLGFSVHPESTTYTGNAGRVFEPWGNYATAIATLLTGNATFMTFLNQPNVDVFITGHSMGGAVAELVAERLAPLLTRGYPTLVQFGAPRVGNQRYVDNRNAMIRRRSIYCNEDPVHWFPMLTSHNFIGGFTSVGVAFTLFVPDPGAFKRDRLGVRLGSVRSGIFHPLPQLLLDLQKPFDESNRWYDHLAFSYRTMYSNLAAQVGGRHRDRYLPLEFNDDNQWQVQFRPGDIASPGWSTLGTQPDPIDPLDNSDLLDTIRQRATPIRDTDGEGYGGGWDETPAPRPLSSVIGRRR